MSFIQIIEVRTGRTGRAGGLLPRQATAQDVPRPVPDRDLVADPI